MTPLQALQAAPITERSCSLGADLGTIEPGKMADLVAVPDNSLQDVTSMEHVAFVMKAGKIIKPLAAK